MVHMHEAKYKGFAHVLTRYVKSHNLSAVAASCISVVWPSCSSLLSLGITDDNVILPLSSWQNNNYISYNF